MFGRFSTYLSNDIAIDLGTANTLVYIKGSGIVLNEPSVVAVDQKTKKVYAVGHEAKAMLGKTPDHIVAIRPMKDGVIADFEITEVMLREFIRKSQKKKFFIRPRIVISVPSGITEVERRAVIDSAQNAGAREVYLVAEPIAAAIGVGLPVDKPSGNMVIDIGGGTTEIAVIALNGIVTDISIRVGGDKMDEVIVQHIKKAYNLLIGDQTAEQVKMTIGSATNLGQEREMEIKGRDLVSGIPKTLRISSVEIREALAEPMSQIVAALKTALEQTPPELAADIVDRGIVMTGGGSLLGGIDVLLKEETNLPINVVEDPLTCVVLGTGKILGNLHVYERIIIKPVVKMQIISFLFEKHPDKTVLAVAVMASLLMLSGNGGKERVGEGYQLVSPLPRRAGRGVIFVSVDQLGGEQDAQGGRGLACARKGEAVAVHGGEEPPQAAPGVPDGFVLPVSPLRGHRQVVEQVSSLRHGGQGRRRRGKSRHGGGGVSRAGGKGGAGIPHFVQDPFAQQ